MLKPTKKLMSARMSTTAEMVIWPHVGPAPAAGGVGVGVSPSGTAVPGPAQTLAKGLTTMGGAVLAMGRLEAAGVAAGGEGVPAAAGGAAGGGELLDMRYAPKIFQQDELCELAVAM